MLGQRILSFHLFEPAMTGSHQDGHDQDGDDQDQESRHEQTPEVQEDHVQCMVVDLVDDDTF